jgi:hypothetical protein
MSNGQAELTYWFSVCLWSLVIGCIPGAIAKNKGHSFAVWWLFGAALFVVALPLSIVLKNEKNEKNASIDQHLQMRQLEQQVAELQKKVAESKSDTKGP